MTKEQCDVCRFAPPSGTYSTCTGDDLPVWSCDKIDDPRMPFDMEDDTDCPCFEMMDEDRLPVCRKCGEYLDTDVILSREFGYDDNLYVIDKVYCPNCGARYIRNVVYELVVVHEELNSIDREDKELIQSIKRRNENGTILYTGDQNQ